MRYINSRLIVYIYSALILVGSSIPGRSFPNYGIFTFDKMLHLIEYSILGWLLMSISEQKLKKLITGLILIGVIFAAFDEFWQSFIPGRNASIYDWFADSAGVVLGSIMYFSFFKFVPRKTGRNNG